MILRYKTKHEHTEHHLSGIFEKTGTAGTLCVSLKEIKYRFFKIHLFPN